MMKKAAIGIVFSKDRKKVLLVKRRDVPVWVLPGGGIEDNETAETAVERELFEETSLHVKTSRTVGQYLPINRLTSETFVFECSCDSIPEKIAPQEETLEVAFFPLENLPRFFFFLHQEWLNDALLNMPCVIIRPTTSVTWWTLAKIVATHPLLLLRYLLSRMGLPLNSKTDYTLHL